MPYGIGLTTEGGGDVTEQHGLATETLKHGIIMHINSYTYVKPIKST
jgi:hypothetical protein